MTVLSCIKRGLIGLVLGLAVAVVAPLHLFMAGMDEPDSRFQMFVLTLVLFGAILAGLVLVLVGVSSFWIGTVCAYFVLFAVLGIATAVSSDFLG